jgi:hypothetical protein
MRAKGIIILIVILLLICVETYLIASSIIEKSKQEKDVHDFCIAKCNFNQSTSYWEFSGENGIKGFTTENECFNYCSKVKMGFAYALQDFAASVLDSIKNIFQK